MPRPVYVIGTEVPPPGGQAGEHGGPAVTRVEDAERGLELTREAFARPGLDRGLAPGDRPRWSSRASSSATRSCTPTDRAPPRACASFSEGPGASSSRRTRRTTRPEDALRALVEDHFAILKVGPELTFAFREAVFALEAIERELSSGGRPTGLSGLRRRSTRP